MCRKGLCRWFNYTVSTKYTLRCALLRVCACGPKRTWMRCIVTVLWSDARAMTVYVLYFHPTPYRPATRKIVNAPSSCLRWSVKKSKYVLVQETTFQNRILFTAQSRNVALSAIATARMPPRVTRAMKIVHVRLQLFLRDVSDKIAPQTYNVRTHVRSDVLTIYNP
jgi:hypothetical protein